MVLLHLTYCLVVADYDPEREPAINWMLAREPWASLYGGPAWAEDERALLTDNNRFFMGIPT